MTPFRSERLPNGLCVDFSDRTTRYFGDYHRVRVEVRIAVTAPSPASWSELKVLERMGVASAEVLAVRDRLAEDYWQHASRYLAHPEFIHRALARQGVRRRVF